MSSGPMQRNAKPCDGAARHIQAPPSTHWRMTASPTSAGCSISSRFLLLLLRLLLLWLTRSFQHPPQQQGANQSPGRKSHCPTAPLLQERKGRRVERRRGGGRRGGRESGEEGARQKRLALQAGSWTSYKHARFEAVSEPHSPALPCMAPCDD